MDVKATFEPKDLIKKLLNQPKKLDFIIENARDLMKADMIMLVTAHDSGQSLSLEIPWYLTVVWTSAKSKDLRKKANSWHGQLLDQHYKTVLIELQEEKQMILSCKDMKESMLKRFSETSGIETTFISEVKMITRKKSILPIKFLGRKEPILYHFLIANFQSDVSKFTNINEDMRICSNEINQLF